MLQAHFISFLVAVLVSFVLTWRVREFAVTRGLVDAPGSSRRVHTRPVPRLGGVAVFGAFWITLLVIQAASQLTGFASGSSWYLVLAVMAPGSMVFLLGLYDDLHSISPYLKFGVQILAALLLYSAGFRILRVSLLGGHPLAGALALPLTILWVLWITNAFNLIDGLDGLAAGSALFSVLIILVLAALNGNYAVSFFCAVLAGAILGFLRFNFNPASIFLGDCGSLFIGFLLSALGMAGAAKSPTMVAVAIPVVSFGLPVLDTTIAVVRRFLSGKPLFSADGEHIHHKLLERGLSQRQVVVILYGVSALLGIMSLFLLHPSGNVMMLIFVLLAIGIWMGVQQLGYHEFVELQRVVQRTMDQKQIIKNNLAIRRAAAALNNCKDLAQMCQILDAAFRENEFDCFELRSSELRLSVAPPPTFHDEGGDLVYCWRKQNGSSAPDSASAWKLRLSLVAEDGTSLGSFVLSRAYKAKPMLADVNLLTTFGFHSALTGALQRMRMEQNKIAVLEPASPALGTPEMLKQ